MAQADVAPPQTRHGFTHRYIVFVWSATAGAAGRGVKFHATAFWLCTETVAETQSQS